jgi:hypothetical protein
MIWLKSLPPPTLEPLRTIVTYEAGKTMIEARTGHVFEDDETLKGAFA